MYFVKTVLQTCLADDPFDERFIASGKFRDESGEDFADFGRVLGVEEDGDFFDNIFDQSQVERFDLAGFEDDPKVFDIGIFIKSMVHHHSHIGEGNGDLLGLFVHQKIHAGKQHHHDSKGIRVCEDAVYDQSNDADEGKEFPNGPFLMMVVFEGSPLYEGSAV